MAREKFDFNITDGNPEGEDEREEEEGTHAGDEDEEGGEAEDRGDAVTPGQGEEGDPDVEGGEGEEGEEEEEEPIDRELLQELAGKPNLVPKARLDEVLQQNRQLLEALSAVASTGKTVAAAPAAAEPDPFDLKGKLKAQNAALLEGDEDKALEIALEIEQYRLDEATRRAEANAVQKVEARTAKNEADTIIANAFEKFTFLNDQSEDFNADALDEVLIFRNHYISKGDSLPKALQKALDKVCPQYVEGDEEGEDEQPGKGKAAAAATGKRDPNKVIRNAKAARAQPPATGKAGTANRETIDTSKLDLENMDDDKYDALPEAVKARLRGDMVG